MATSPERPLKDAIALVAGATRGAGRGIARALGQAGATVYCSGRSSRAGRPEALPWPSEFATEARPETIEDTAEMVTALGGQGIAVRADHTDPAQVQALCAQIGQAHGGLDILVNDIWGGDALTEWGKPFWELSLEKALAMQQRAVHTHLITSRHAVPLMLDAARREARPGLVLEITDGEGEAYRGNLAYDLAKSATIRLAHGMAAELRPHNVAAIALTPGFLRSEAMLEHFGVTEDNWRAGAEKDPHFAQSESPAFIGRAVVALAADAGMMARSGGVFGTWRLARDYGFTDADGSRPDWGRYFESIREEPK